LPINTAIGNFEVGDTSRNFLPVDVLMMGESYHNNHHKNGSRANFGGVRWHEIDPTYLVIRLPGQTARYPVGRTAPKLRWNGLKSA